MSGRKIYSTELKLEIVERYLKGDIGIKKLAQEYHVSYGDIQKWRDALFQEQRGRTSKMGTKRPRKQKTNIETNEDLLAEVQRLRMENEYLKKLNALIQKRERSEKPTK